MNELEWNVWIYDINARKIRSHNVFRHSSFRSSVEKLLASAASREEFADKLKSELMYYYWCKSEWEVVIRAWCGGNEEIKVDVYQQVMLNWELFLEYVWSHRKVRKERSR